MGAVTATTDKPKRAISPLLVLGVAVLVVILGAGGWFAWSLFGTNALARQAAVKEFQTIRSQWAEPADAPADPEAPPVVEHPQPGDAAWIIRIPRIGAEWPVIAGVAETDLNRGVGWYPTTALPGQAGNFAVAGRRVTNGEPFRRLLELRAGDVVLVETRTATFTYTIVSPPGGLTVNQDDTWVLDPVPGETDVVPTKALITLTTEEDLVPSADRAVGFGELTETEKK